ncbi:MAG: patatin-like phospholipase family protein [Candidatus Buchananbacteria bacterium]
MPHKKQKIGLALGSGGVKGLSHIGVIKVLEKNNIPIDFIAGVSIGALIGAYYAAYKDVIRMEKTALASNWKTAFYLLDPAWRGALIKGTKVESLIQDWLEDKKFSSLKIPLTVIATDLNSGQEVDISDGDLFKAIRASLSVPVVFRPIEINGMLLSDGGLSNPLPDDTVRKMGADKVITVSLDSGKFDQNDSTLLKNPSITKISIRALNILRYHLAQKSLNSSDVLIEPKVTEIGLVGWNKFFDNHQVSQLIKAGEDAAIAALPKIKKLLNN